MLAIELVVRLIVIEILKASILYQATPAQKMG